MFLSQQTHLVSAPVDNEIFGMLGDSEAEGMALEFVPGEEESMNAPVVRGRPGRSVHDTDVNELMNYTLID